MSEIVEFYCGKGRDPHGERFSHYVQIGVEEREGRHDYIQWLFPLMEKSRFNLDAPVLTDEDIQILSRDTTARYRLRLATLQMLLFYHENTHWRVSGDHNHMRITRILKCLCLLDARELAEEFYVFLGSCPEQEEFQKAWPFWDEAMQVR